MLVSVIIPAYNCARYIGDALSSLLAQDMGDFEVFIVNDGSTDRTLEEVDRFVREDKRIRVITVENGGPAKARNLGIREAKGRYLYFMDADDQMLPGMLAAMTALAEARGLDCVACGYTMENVSGRKPHTKLFTFEDFVAEEQAEFRNRLMPLIKAHLMYVVWNKLYRAALVKERGILFNDYLSGEDRIFNSRLFPHIRRFGFTGRPFYRYFLRGQQTLANRFVDHRFEAALACHEALITAYREMGLYEGENQRAIGFIFVKSVMACFTQLSAKGCHMSWKQKKGFIRETLQNAQVQEAIQRDDGEAGYSRLVCRLLRGGKPLLIYWMARIIFLLQTRFNDLYLNLKHGKSAAPETGGKAFPGKE